MAWLAVIAVWTYLAAWAQNPWVSLVLINALWLQTVRRLHDFGRTGWWIGAILLGEIALTNLSATEKDSIWLSWVVGGFPIACLSLFVFAPGHNGWNRFGPPPGVRSMPAADA
jgi:uncharacterized membrane protein YhaH (DUF805 family)